MRDSKRIKRILGKIETIWNENPDWRLGQLLVNITHDPVFEAKRFEVNPFYYEDSDLEDELNFTLGYGKYDPFK